MAALDPSRGRILIVDDEEANVQIIELNLREAGFTRTRTATDARTVLAICDEFGPDVVLLDLRMPHTSGLDLLRALRSTERPHHPVSVIVITADPATETKRAALEGGANDFLVKPFDQVELVLRVRNLLIARLMHLELQRHNDLLEDRVRERTAYLTRALESLARSEAATREASEETIHRLALAAELRDSETGWHIERMSRYSALLGEKLGMDQRRCEMLRLASSMHDVGKIGVSDTILRKPEALTPHEFESIKVHPAVGHRVLSNSNAEVLELAALIALTHHERFDGSGYPRGLRGKDIPLEGRIATVADVFDALTSDRVYRSAYPVAEARKIMRRGRNSIFDPKIYDAFEASIDEILSLKKRYHDRAA